MVRHTSSMTRMDFTDVDQSQIKALYENAGVLITGATGFLGKVLIEKLLRSCTTVNTLYLLIRPKEGKSAEQRLAELFNDVLFDEMKKANHKYRYQVEIVEGDCSLPFLGVSPSMYMVLQKKVSIVFHGAATVRFEENLKIAVEINVHGTEQVIKLCRTLKNLKALVHISTAYSHCHGCSTSVDEVFYDPPSCYKNIIERAKSATHQEMEKLTPSLLEKWPNTYCFTKALAEHLMKEQEGLLPAAVFRPAIVSMTYKEPLIGWIDNLYGPTGVVVGAGCGIIRTMHCDGDKDANVVPVDMTVNALLASAMDAATRFRNGKKDIRVFNYVSTTDNPITYNDLLRMTLAQGKNFPSMKAVWYYSFTFTKNYYVSLLLTALLHFLPGLVIDVVSVLLRQKPRMLKVYYKYYKYTKSLSFFAVNSWHFSNDNVTALWLSLNEADQRDFNFNITTLDWQSYLDQYFLGCRVHYLKDDISTLPQARRRWTRLYWCHQAVKMIFFGVVLKMIYSGYKIAYPALQ